MKKQASWCHGAPGIALGRLGMLRRTTDEGLLADAQAALEHTSEASDLGNHGLCHGALGNVEPLLIAAEILPNGSHWRALAHERGTSLVNDISTCGCRCARPGYLEVPGLMTGIAGIGFQLLRLADPANTPSLLLLEAPRSGSQLPSARHKSINDVRHGGISS